MQDSPPPPAAAAAGHHDDDASMIGREQKIQDMRKRVELQLAAMVQGNGTEFDKLRQQVADLRTNPMLHEDDTDNILGTTGTVHKTTVEDPMGALQSNTNNNNGMSSRETTVSEILQLDEEYTTTTTSTGAPDNEATVEVTDTEITDPYGDSGDYNGSVLLLQTQKPHGIGKMEYQDGRTYHGGWKYGQWHGKGMAVFSNGDRFDGNYDLDRRHGFGTYQWKDGRVYEGESLCVYFRICPCA